MKAQLALVFLLAGLGLVTAATPAFASGGIPSCTRTLDSNGYTYTLTVSPCSNTGVALNSVVTMTATTNDPSIVRVDFTVIDPTLTPTTYAVTPSPYTQAVTLSIPGTWYIHASFCTSAGNCFGSSFDVVSETVQILVLNALPLGTAAAFAVSLLGLVAYTKVKKRPLPA
jgi:hypothetical protein